MITLRCQVAPGVVELSTGVAISPRHAVTAYPLGSSPYVYVLDSGEAVAPDSIIICPDLRIAVIRFPDELFETYQLPSEDLPEIGQSLALVGPAVTGIQRVDARVVSRHEDGTFLLATDNREGLMGAAAFDSEKGFLGLITGLTTVRREHLQTSVERLVLLPSQIWCLWAELALFGQDSDGLPFGVMAIAHTQNNAGSPPAGVHILAVENDSRAWKAGLRPGDLVYSVDGIQIYHPLTLMGLVLTESDTLTAVVWRLGRTRNVSIPPPPE
ncbi:hypothetical protein GF402_05890 [Candidatus Fermentibacteria bacterium]|nr:hypothetical protein [Candidatus Fermentibacteria bacterium]